MVFPLETSHELSLCAKREARDEKETILALLSAHPLGEEADPWISQIVGAGPEEIGKFRQESPE